MYHNWNISIFSYVFSCSCPIGYKGKQCQDIEFCKLRECPSNSECRNLPNDYECVTNITLHGMSSNTSLQYAFKQNDKFPAVPSNTNSLEIMYRSKTGGMLLYLSSQQDSYPDKHLYFFICLLYTSPSPRDRTRSRMPSSA